jgi:ABC-2 type transport system permease protein
VKRVSKALSPVPVFKSLVLINPLVYANEALRFVLTPQIESMPLGASILGLVVSSALMGYFGFKRFHRMATGTK